MGQEIFQRQDSVLGGVLLSDTGNLDFGAEVGLGVLVQGLNLQYTQNVNRIYEINSTGGTMHFYYVVGRTQGQGQIGRALGPTADMSALYTEYGCACKASTNTLILNVGGDCTGDCMAPAQGDKFTMTDCFISQIGIALQAQDMLINETLQLQFGSLQLG